MIGPSRLWTALFTPKFTDSSLTGIETSVTVPRVSSLLSLVVEDLPKDIHPQPDSLLHEISSFRFPSPSVDPVLHSFRPPYLLP